MAIEVKDIAEQLTLIDFGIYAAIEACSFQSSLYHQVLLNSFLLIDSPLSC